MTIFARLVTEASERTLTAGTVVSGSENATQDQRGDENGQKLLHDLSPFGFATRTRTWKCYCRRFSALPFKGRVCHFHQNKTKWSRSVTIRLPPRCKRGALPIELLPQINPGRTRTYRLLLLRQTALPFAYGVIGDGPVMIRLLRLHRPTHWPIVLPSQSFREESNPDNPLYKNGAWPIYATEAKNFYQLHIATFYCICRCPCFVL